MADIGRIGHVRGSIVVTDEGRNLRISKTHSPNEVFTVESADRDDLIAALDAATHRPSRLRPCPVAGCIGHSEVKVGGSRIVIHGSTCMKPGEMRLSGETDDSTDHAALVAYLLSAVRRKDWHAVSDAANDLRVLDARSGRDR